MRDVTAELKPLRLYGMVGAWEEIIAQGTQAAVESSRWLIEHLLEAEQTDRVMHELLSVFRLPTRWQSLSGILCACAHRADRRRELSPQKSAGSRNG